MFRLQSLPLRRGFVLVLSMLGLAAAGATAAETSPDATMLRHPDVSASHVVFVYANDVWLVPREGGTATPLSSPIGAERFPRFSPDGQSIAFVGSYDGNPDLYVLPVGGGVPRRITHHPAAETLCDWTPDGRLLFASNGLAGLGRQEQLFVVPATGGLPVRLPVPYGTRGAISPDGLWLAYTPHSRDERTWKRYRGGMATDLWLFHLKEHTAQRITAWEGTDTQPMWHRKALYYLSDAGPAHRWNVWQNDPAGGQARQVTFFTEHDVRWPSIGPGTAGKGEIVLQNGPHLYLLDLATERTRLLEVRIPRDLPTLRAKDVDVSEAIADGGISPTGKRVVVEARGDVWTLPARDGAPRNLTRTGGVAERAPSWSPDGRWVAYFTDDSGEYELTVTRSDGKGETRRLTTDGGPFKFASIWSPDSKRIAFTDKTGSLKLHEVESGATRHVARERWRGEPEVSWSHDGAWLAYTSSGDNAQPALWLHEVATGASTRVTQGMYADSAPAFDREGKYLYFASSRHFAPRYGDLDTTFVYAGTQQLFVVPLRGEVGSPFAPKSDEEEFATDDEEPGDDADGDADGDEASTTGAVAPAEDAAGANESNESTEAEAPTAAGDSEVAAEEPAVLAIDLESFERRAVALPVPPGVFSGLAVADGGALLYARRPARGESGTPEIQWFDVKDDQRQEKTVVAGAGGFDLSADGKKLLVLRGEDLFVVDAKPGQKLERGVRRAGMVARIDPRHEWPQLVHDAWRLLRDFFYDPGLHGVDWPVIGRRYQAMVEDCVNREDVGYVIREMISELNVGHAYYRSGGDVERPTPGNVGMLGVDFELGDGAYRIARILEGAPWDVGSRGPLSQPGVDVKAGDFLLAVNGVPLDVSLDPWAAFVGLAGQVVTLTVSESPRLDEEAREVLVEPLASESGLRYAAWVERNRRTVEEASGGRIGYLYVPDTGVRGQNELVRQFFGQRHLPALLIDERWNGGGQIPTRFIELLDRPNTNWWARRDAADFPWPPDAHQGPKAMLINGLAGSGGDCFPYYFRQSGLGKLIGTRTWGGLIGMSGNPSLIDGSAITVPTIGFFENDGSWGIEGHGVDPDLEVIDDPAAMVDGGDPQLEAAIAHLLAELEVRPFLPPRRPAGPDRSGMGIRDEDR